MKQILLLNIISLLLLAGCGSNTSNFESKSQTNVSMIVDPANINISLIGKAKVIVKNNTTDSLKLGDLFSIEFYDGTSWKRLPVLDDILFNDIAYIIPPGKAKELLVNLQPKPFNYKSGKYRVYKTVQVMPYNRKLDLTAEFFIR